MKRKILMPRKKKWNLLKCQDIGNTTKSCYREESNPPIVFINTISILVLSHLRQLSVKLALMWQVKKKMATNEAKMGEESQHDMAS